MTELDLEALARDFEWSSMRADGGEATERATGRRVRIEAPSGRHFIRPFERAAIAGRVREIGDSRLLPVLRTEPWIVVSERDTALPLELGFDAALEVLDAVLAVEAHGVGVRAVYAERVESSFRVWVEPTQVLRVGRSTALSRAVTWLDQQLRRVVGTKALRKKLRSPRDVEEAIELWGARGTPAARRSVDVRPPGRAPLPDLAAALRHGEALWLESPGDPNLAAPLGAIHHHFGCVAMAEGDLDEAERRLDQAIALFSSARSLTTRALLARRRGDDVLEAELLSRPCEESSSPSCDGYRRLRARAYSLARRGEVDRALQMLEVAFAPGHPDRGWVEGFRARFAPEE
ncbi:MAG: hypothetical protein H6722_16055 [Sandaracinus sp.]|nr:hypothetical protein [Sandaracinus sp.]